MKIAKYILIFTIIVVVTFIISISYIYKNNYGSRNDVTYLEYRDPGFTEEEKKIVKDKIELLQQELFSASNDETRFNVMFNISVQYYVLGEYGVAKQYMTDALEIQSNNATAWAQLHVIDLARTDYEGAQYAINKALEFNDSNPQYWRWQLELMQGPLKTDAVKIDNTFKQAIEGTGQSADMLAMYAKYLELSGRDADAISYFEKAQKQYPDWEALYQDEIDRIKQKYR